MPEEITGKTNSYLISNHKETENNQSQTVDKVNFNLPDINKKLEYEIAERKRLEEELRRSEERYKEMADMLPHPVYETDLTGRFTFANRSAFETTGYNRDDLEKGIYVQEILIEKDRAVELFKKRLSGEETDLHEYTIIRKDGKTIPVLTISVPVFQNNRPVGLRGTVIDITELKRKEGELLRLATALEQTGELVIITDEEGNFEYVNPAFLVTTGYTFEEIKNKNIDILRSEKDSDEYYRELWNTVREGNIWRGHVTNKKKNGQFYETEVSISPVRNTDGIIKNYVIVKRDITDKIKLEKQLKQSQKMEAIGSLAGGVAHDFNNILASILTYTELMLYGNFEEEKKRFYLSQIVRICDRGKEMVKQILSFSRYREEEKRFLHIGPIIKETLKLIRAILPTTIEIYENIEVEDSR